MGMSKYANRKATRRERRRLYLEAIKDQKGKPIPKKYQHSSWKATTKRTY